MTNAAGAQGHPTFNQPVIIYQENFLALPVGWSVPSGYLDQTSGKWVQHRDANGDPLNGSIIKICNYTNNAANIDVDGDGCDDNAELDLDERELLYDEYQPATNVELWRVPVLHFSSLDFNYGFGLPPTAKAPEPQVSSDDIECPSLESGSIIECET